jgi:hypothetical protein
MQEIKKRSIVLASVLKPADDTRMLEKMAVSLANTGKWNVHVIGSGTQAPQVPNITFHLLGSFKRVSIKRLMTPWRVLNLLFRIKPGQVIITTHELLFPGVIYKLLTGSKLYYDIQENYKLNILNTNAFPPILRIVVAIIVRAVEWLTSPFIKHFFLAEKTYSNELPFLGKKYTVLENKALLPASFKRKVDTSKVNLLFSGTLDFSTGVFEAITLAKKLNEQSGNVSLTIIGFAATEKVREMIREAVKQHAFIETIGIDQPVPHSQILQAIRGATAGIIYYPHAAHTANRIPTKLYEYLAAQLPILYDTKATWRAIPEQWQAGVPVDFYSPNETTIRGALTSVSFYPGTPQGVLWESESELLIKTLG